YYPSEGTSAASSTSGAGDRATASARFGRLNVRGLTDKKECQGQWVDNLLLIADNQRPLPRERPYRFLPFRECPMSDQPVRRPRIDQTLSDSRLPPASLPPV